MLLATSENRIGAASVRSCLLFERAVRGTLVRRQQLAFDTRFAAAASGKPEPVGHLFLLLDGHYVSERGEQHDGPFGLLLADDEWERRGDRSRTFRTDGPRVDVVQLRIAKEHLLAPIGLDAGPLRVPSACWDATHALLDAPDAPALARLVDELARAGIVASSVTSTVIDEEPERFRRLWSALEPLYREYGATASLKQLASSLDMSMRQVGRDAKELSAAFGIGGGYRDALLVLRLRMAVLMLAAKGAAVADVARLVGYGSPIAMARAFRDAKLPSPSVIQAALGAE